MSVKAPVGFVGLGRIGAVMASRLAQAGYPLVVCDVDSAACRRLEQSGARIASTPLQLANEVEVTFLSLPTPRILQEVVTGAEGLAGGSKLRVVVDLSTTGPRVAREVCAALRSSGKELIDAPVSGGVAGAAAGTLTLMVAGSNEAVTEVTPMLQQLGKQLFVMGLEPGLGQTMKLVNNMIAACCAVASFEATVFGAKEGLPANRMLEVLNVSSGRSFATLEKMPKSVLPGTFPPGFATELMLKDVNLGVTEADASGAQLRLTKAAQGFFQQAVEEGFAAKDYAETIKMFEGWAGAVVRSS
ncbi:NAD(P)-dependent oxidoreductase [Enterovirga sp. CN4-39]|uniref:NAD(P)-dependent oxidoreductase n=1 Tax=Enterovirga sp. CN4-39 TaxID=3400910 RepID=UPI003C050BEA